jgi:hypothetical protein
MIYGKGIDMAYLFAAYCEIKYCFYCTFKEYFMAWVLLFVGDAAQYPGG